MASAIPAAMVSGEDGAVPRRLDAAAPILGDVSGPRPVVATVEVPEGHAVAVTVRQVGVDLVLRVSEPAGGDLLEVDDTGGVTGTEVALWIADAGGAYRLELRPRLENAAGGYEVRCDPPRPATAEDRHRATAVRALSEGARLRSEAKPESRRLAQAEYERALGLFQGLQDRRGEALALAGLGASAYALSDFGTALPRLEAALALWRSMGDRWHEASVLHTLGKVWIDQGRGQEAAARYAEARVAFRDSGDRGSEADALNWVGVSHETAGDGPRAQEAYEDALALLRELGDRTGEVGTLRNLVARRWAAGDLQLALDTALEALAASRALGDPAQEAGATTNVGQLYADLGDFPRALRYLEQGFALSRGLESRRPEMVAVAALGYVHRLRGALEESREAYLRALEITRGLGVYGKRAAPYQLRNLGVVSLQAGQHVAALDYLEQALAGWREWGDRGEEAIVLSFLCRALVGKGDLAKARAYGLEALRLGEGSGSPRVRLMSFYQLAQVELAAVELARAAERIGAALEILESTRRSVRSADLRASYVASVRTFYDLHLDVLMAQHAAQPMAGFDRQGFQAAERARARTLLELLAESRTDVREGVDPQLLDRERTLRARLSTASERSLRASGPEPRKTIEAEMEALTSELEGVEADIRRASPRYAALTQPPPFSVAELQSLLGDDTVLLEYSLGEEKSHVWAVDAHTLTSARLPSKAVIDAAARRVYDAFADEKADAATAAAELSRLVLAPVADRLGTGRVVVVADGALQYIPFAALPHPLGGDLLVASHELVGLPSASTLGLLRREEHGRRRASRTLAVLADPVFDADDERVAAARGLPKEAASPGPFLSTSPGGRLTRAAAAMGFAGAPPRLAFTRREARAILQGLPPGSALAAFDFEASRETALSGALVDYRFVHLATHGFLNTARPDLSGVVLSLVDRQGRPRPGFLTAADAFNLRLSADLVVLSGCRTALGRDVRGEGLVGLTRGFMYAGTNGVLASLWPVDDAATAGLMARIYAGLLGNPPRRPAAALRVAQKDLMNQRRFRHPYFWAGFQLQGEWR